MKYPETDGPPRSRVTFWTTNPKVPLMEIQFAALMPVVGGG